MRQHPETSTQAGERPEAPRADRRALLKAAAAAAPIVATLPCGAALANTSAAQCIANNQAANPPEVDTPATPGGPQEDTFLRYMAWQRRCGRALYYYVYTPAGNQWYKADGTVENPTCGDLTPGGTGDVKVYVLAHWIPNPASTSVTANGFYPVTKLDGTNQGITASCYCSVDPGVGGGTWCRI